MRVRSTALILAVLLGAAPGMGGLAAAQGDAAALLPDPAPAPPAPADLARPPALVLPVPPQQPPPPMPRGMELLPGGGVRLRSVSAPLAPATRQALEEVGRRLATMPRGRFMVEVQVSGPEDDISMARRLSLNHAKVVKEALVAGGLDATRIDLRPLGRTEDAADLVDVLPPGGERRADVR